MTLFHNTCISCYVAELHLHSTNSFAMFLLLQLTFTLYCSPPFALTSINKQQNNTWATTLDHSFNNDISLFWDISQRWVPSHVSALPSWTLYHCSLDQHMHHPKNKTGWSHPCLPWPLELCVNHMFISSNQRSWYPKSLLQSVFILVWMQSIDLPFPYSASPKPLCQTFQGLHRWLLALNEKQTCPPTRKHTPIKRSGIVIRLLSALLQEGDIDFFCSGDLMTACLL